ncbi:hypothetical protein IQ260_07685 [Leptolyngbya cf. ectocarpi LEGE 11479]|uniref:Type I restriction enzyme R protein N-terminal domain-containing protein n=1 Tax=Leptolyngbya cf. ectocarpi LEGE 11479 TaxID=1828722 RepID=A0A928X2E9_LEPEC|nr:hypothetical protein [Leptolyngbya ectocarpi]MBE9066531.1 hypothetical protein [Leptolyngbya cf. ectocarpi LEGE 11479]
MTRPPILDKTQSYTFSKYFELTADPEDVFAELGITLKKQVLRLPVVSESLDFLSSLEKRLLQTLQLVDLTSEMARRETLIAPVLLDVCAHAHQQLKIEYTVDVSKWLRGSFDYFIPGTQNLLIIEAKQADLARGFVQLGAELAALDQWTRSDSPLLYGAITTGDAWKFGCFERSSKTLLQDIRLYSVPSDLKQLVSILLGIIRGEHTD